MNLIYEGAEITIINASGVNAQSGLPGVQNELRPLQPKARIGNTVLVSTLQSPRELINNSEWSTRGWTYQEGVLSRRRLIFTSEQVYFECAAMVVWETVFIPLVPFHTKSKRNFRSVLKPGMLSGKLRFESFRLETNDSIIRTHELVKHLTWY